MTPEQAKVLADHLQSLMSEKDAADVAKWAANPKAVRELLKHTPIDVQGYEYDIRCIDCDALSGEPHRTVILAGPRPPRDRSEQAARERTHWPDGSRRATPCDCAACEQDLARDRATSDARGMEAVEAEAWELNARLPYVRDGAR